MTSTSRSFLGPRTALRGSLAVVLLLCVSAAAPNAARASHYRLPADGLISDDESSTLGKAGVRTTAELLEATARVARRESLSKATGLSLARLTTLACQVDLLRIRGLGPSMVRLLQAAGVRHTRDLKGLSPTEVYERLRAANSIHHIAPVVPQEAVLEDWIAQAGRLEWVLEGTQ